ncbi:carbon-nitrogen hydrolase [Zychaea mexicana]|uniref:carbon-nitrogen hydrolase n=1 Tax=Zychaea mexicana TaxID=64656 RepID=UPI0022FE5636|nr:carbon-nitrogen hydrolase [Zychaea mexicana]KAI9489885.1 carbon-nitrogen hydrolase [Zychaea mexicana]
MASTEQKLKVGVVQVGTPLYNLDKTLEKLEKYVTEASVQQVDLLVFPEAFIGGYPKYSTFGMHLGERTPAGRDEYLKYYSNAIEVPGPVTGHLSALASKANMYLVIGVIEKEAKSGTLFCTAIHIDPTHGLVAKHRKIMPTAQERTVWGLGDGTTLPVVTFERSSTLSARVSSTICWENYVPMLRQHYYNKGTQIYCAPTVDTREVWTSTMTHIALEGRCFVLSANQFMRCKDFPEGHPLPANSNPESIALAGGSMIVTPLGEVLAGPLREREGLLTADIDLDDIIRSKLDMDNSPTGHYSRPDIFRLLVNEAGFQG